eukprot:352817-Chlamydomonas_euryale.AAC.7
MAGLYVWLHSGRCHGSWGLGVIGPTVLGVWTALASPRDGAAAAATAVLAAAAAAAVLAAARLCLGFQVAWAPPSLGSRFVAPAPAPRHWQALLTARPSHSGLRPGARPRGRATRPRRPAAPSPGRQRGPYRARPAPRRAPLPPLSRRLCRSGRHRRRPLQPGRRSRAAVSDATDRSRQSARVGHGRTAPLNLPGAHPRPPRRPNAGTTAAHGPGRAAAAAADDDDVAAAAGLATGLDSVRSVLPSAAGRGQRFRAALAVSPSRCQRRQGSAAAAAATAPSKDPRRRTKGSRCSRSSLGAAAAAAATSCSAAAATSDAVRPGRSVVLDGFRRGHVLLQPKPL